MKPPLSIDAAICTHPGDRELNEDEALILRGGQVCAVADGMGGTRGGAVASQIAMQVVESTITARGEDLADPGQITGILHAVCEGANAEILLASQREPRLLGMGTTLTLAFVNESSFSFVHVGDTRLYRWSVGTLVQHTEDHTRSQQWVNRGVLSPERAERSVDSSILVKFLGTVRRLDPQVGCGELNAGELLLLCSDGVYGPLGRDRIAEILAKDRSARALSETLVNAARNADGVDGVLDNLTALVVKCMATKEAT